MSSRLAYPTVYFEMSLVLTRRVLQWSFMNVRGNHPLVDDSLPEYP
jgi:hypothetical protein